MSTEAIYTCICVRKFCLTVVDFETQKVCLRMIGYVFFKRRFCFATPPEIPSVVIQKPLGFNVVAIYFSFLISLLLSLNYSHYF